MQHKEMYNGWSGPITAKRISDLGIAIPALLEKDNVEMETWRENGGSIMVSIEIEREHGRFHLHFRGNDPDYEGMEMTECGRLLRQAFPAMWRGLAADMMFVRAIQLVGNTRGMYLIRSQEELNFMDSWGGLEHYRMPHLLQGFVGEKREEHPANFPVFLFAANGLDILMTKTEMNELNSLWVSEEQVNSIRQGGQPRSLVEYQTVTTINSSLDRYHREAFERLLEKASGSFLTNSRATFDIQLDCSRSMRLRFTFSGMGGCDMNEIQIEVMEANGEEILVCEVKDIMRDILFPDMRPGLLKALIGDLDKK